MPISLAAIVWSTEVILVMFSVGFVQLTNSCNIDSLIVSGYNLSLFRMSSRGFAESFYRLEKRASSFSSASVFLGTTGFLVSVGGAKAGAVGLKAVNGAASTFSVG